VATPAANASSAKGSESAAPDIPYESYKLKNGLEVIFHVDHSLPLVAVNLWYHVAAVNEVLGKTGFAHLFEHMMFQGSGHLADDEHFKILERIGATGMNGTTSFDRTNYFETVPSHHLETALWLESDRMGFLLASLTQEKLDNQKEVVKNERRQSYETQPYGLAEEKMWHALYPEPHPYHGMVIGSMDDLNSATLEDVEQFFKSYYAPANATLVLAGDFEPEHARALIEKYFGTLTSEAKPALPELAPLSIKEEVVIHHDEPVASLAKVEMAWLTPAIFSPGDAEADLLAAVLSAGDSSRLERRLVRELQLAQSVTAGQYSLGAQSLFFIESVARPGVDPEKLKSAIDAVLTELRKKGVSPSELRRAQNRYETNYFTRLQELGGFGGRADLLQTYNHFVGDPGYIGQDLARYRSVSVDSLKSFVDKYLAPSARVVLFAVPPVKSGDEAKATPSKESK